MTALTASTATAGPVAQGFVPNRTALAAGGGFGVGQSGQSSDAGPGPDKTGAGANGSNGSNGKNAPAGGTVTVNPTFRYDSQAQRMVMLLRDEKTGAVTLQIPSEMALKQYEQAVKRVREEVAANHGPAAGSAGSGLSVGAAAEAASLGVLPPLSSPNVAGSGTGTGADSGAGQGSPRQGAAESAPPAAADGSPNAADVHHDVHHNVVV